MSDKLLFDTTNPNKENLLTVEVGSTIDLGVVVGTDLKDTSEIVYQIDNSRQSIPPMRFVEFAEENGFIYNEETLHYVMSEYLRTETEHDYALTKINKEGDIYGIEVDVKEGKLIIEEVLLGEESEEHFDSVEALNKRLAELGLSPVPVFQTREELDLELNRWVRLHTEQIAFARFLEDEVIEVAKIDVFNGSQLFVQQRTVDLKDNYQLKLLDIFNGKVELDEILTIGNNPLLVAYTDVKDDSVWSCDKLTIFCADKSIPKSKNVYYSILDFTRALEEESGIDLSNMPELDLYISLNGNNIIQDEKLNEIKNQALSSTKGEWVLDSEGQLVSVQEDGTEDEIITAIGEHGYEGYLSINNKADELFITTARGNMLYLLTLIDRLKSGINN